MNRKEFIAINKHLEEVEKPEVAAIYTMAVKAAILDAVKLSSEETVIGDYRYIFTQVQKLEKKEYPTAKLFPTKEGNVFNIMGIMEVINRKNNKNETVYGCLEVLYGAAIIFWVNEQGRISSDELSNQYTRAYSQIHPELNILTTPTQEKKTIQQTNAEVLFEQMNTCLEKLHKNILDENERIKNYEKTINLGHQIMELYPDFQYKSGTYTTMASAAFFMFQFDESNSSKNDYLISAKEYSEKAVSEDNKNQRALTLGVTTSLFTLNIKRASELFSQLSESGLRQACISGTFALSRFTIFLRAQDSFADYRKDMFDFLYSFCEKAKQNEYLLAGAVALSAQLIFSVYGDAYTAYYSFLGNYIKLLREDPSFFDLYIVFCSVCLTPYLNKLDEAVYYGKLGMRYAREQNEQSKATITSFYGVALASVGNKNGIGHCKHAASIFPCDNTYYNCGRCMLLLGKPKEGIEWAKKALYLHEDDMNLMLLADLYKATDQDDLALEYYMKSLHAIQRKEFLHLFTDQNGELTFSVVSQESLNFSLHQIFLNTISIYIGKQDYSHAIVHLHLAEELVPDCPEWIIYKKTLPIIEYSQKELEEARNELLTVKAEVQKQTRLTQEMAEKLINLQDQFRTANMDKYDKWKPFEDEINKIIELLEAEANKDEQRMENIKEKFSNKFSNFSPEAIHFLTTAEILYELHKNNEIDFACIVVEYCKVLERQLRSIMGNEIPESMKMLGQIIGLISSKKESPYAKCLGQLDEVNELRKQSAHTGSLTKHEAERIRNIYFDEGLLDSLN